MSAYFISVFTDSGCMHGCDHQHPTVISAVACISTAGGYVIAMEEESPRSLTLAEETEFQHAMYGHDCRSEKSVDQMITLAVGKMLTQS